MIKNIEEQQGPFQRKLQEKIDSLGLERAKYHHRTLVGNDVHKLLQPNAMKLISKWLKPHTFTTTKGSCIIGSHKLVQQIHTLMTKLAQCYWLYSADRLLCKHEVDNLEKRCISYGKWLPYNFPEEGLKRKLHELVCHIPKKARPSGSVGI